MKLTKENLALIKQLYGNGTMELLKGIAEGMIADLRISRIPLSSADETLRNLYESYGGEKHLRQLFDYLYDLANREG